MKTAAYYVRVSSELQEKKQAIESQIAEVEETIKKDGNRLIKRYVDDGYCGGAIQRPALTELREDLSKGLFEVLYIADFDRLSRNLLNQLLIIEDLKKYNVELRCKGKSLTEENDMLVKFESMFAEYRKKRIAEDSKRGKLYWANNGKLMNTKPPYGYNYIPKNENGKAGRFEINLKEARIVKLIAELYLKYQSPLRVAKELTQRNISTKRGGRWTTEKIRSLLRNEAYIGKIYYNKYYKVEPLQKRIKFTRREAASKRLRDKKDWVAQKIPAILDEDTFNTIQELLKRNYKLFGESKRFYLLSGILRCAKCGSKMNGEMKRIKGRKGGVYYYYQYYRCHNREMRMPLPKTCNAKPVRVEGLDNLVWNAVSKAIQDPNYLRSSIFYYNNQDKERQLLIELQESLLKKKWQMKQKRNKLLDLYETGKIDREAFQDKIVEYAQEGKEIDNLLKELKTRLNLIANKNKVIKEIEEIYKLNKTQLAKVLIPQQKKTLLRAIIKELTYNSDTGEVNLIGHIPIHGVLEPEKNQIYLSKSLKRNNIVSTMRNIIHRD